MSIFVELPVGDYKPDAFDKFLPARGTFDLDDARAMMWMSQLAYETDTQNTIPAIGQLWSFQPITKIQAQAGTADTRAIIGVRNGCTIVAFAGTDPALGDNVITDIRVKLSPRDTHTGFQDACDVAWRKIQPLIETSPRPLFFTGHSLGAALAVLAAETAFDKGITAAAVFTFGMPRAGGPTFAARYNGKLGDRSYRLVHGGDIVPCVPDALIGANPIQFQHVGRLLTCPSNGKFARASALSNTTSNAPRFVAGVRLDFANRLLALHDGNIFALAGPGILGPAYALLPFLIRDHLPDRYLAALAP
jgi:triacylglycerol lipase